MPPKRKMSRSADFLDTDTMYCVDGVWYVPADSANRTIPLKRRNITEEMAKADEEWMEDFKAMLQNEINRMDEEQGLPPRYRPRKRQRLGSIDHNPHDQLAHLDDAALAQALQSAVTASTRPPPAMTQAEAAPLVIDLVSPETAPALPACPPAEPCEQDLALQSQLDIEQLRRRQARALASGLQQNEHVPLQDPQKSSAVFQRATPRNPAAIISQASDTTPTAPQRRRATSKAPVQQPKPALQYAYPPPARAYPGQRSMSTSEVAQHTDFLLSASTTARHQNSQIPSAQQSQDSRFQQLDALQTQMNQEQLMKRGRTAPPQQASAHGRWGTPQPAPSTPGISRALAQKDLAAADPAQAAGAVQRNSTLAIWPTPERTPEDKITPSQRQKKPSSSPNLPQSAQRRPSTLPEGNLSQRAESLAPAQDQLPVQPMPQVHQTPKRIAREDPGQPSNPIDPTQFEHLTKFYKEQQQGGLLGLDHRNPQHVRNQQVAKTQQQARLNSQQLPMTPQPNKHQQAIPARQQMYVKPQQLAMDIQQPRPSQQVMDMKLGSVPEQNHASPQPTQAYARRPPMTPQQLLAAKQQTQILQQAQQPQRHQFSASMSPQMSAEQMQQIHQYRQAKIQGQQRRQAPSSAASPSLASQVHRQSTPMSQFPQQQMDPRQMNQQQMTQLQMNQYAQQQLQQRQMHHQQYAVQQPAMHQLNIIEQQQFQYQQLQLQQIAFQQMAYQQQQQMRQSQVQMNHVQAPIGNQTPQMSEKQIMDEFFGDMV